jgi:hypothetical protein
VRYRIQNVFTGNYVSQEPNFQWRITVINGFNVQFATTGFPPGFPGLIVSQLATVTPGERIFTLWEGNYTLMNIEFFTPLSFDGIGRLNVFMPIAQDLFLTGFYVPRAYYNGDTAQKVAILSWQSGDASNERIHACAHTHTQITTTHAHASRNKQQTSMCVLGTAFVDLDLKVLKFSPTNFGCISTCCLATPTSGDCVNMQILNNSKTSDKVETLDLRHSELVFIGGPRYSYLVYVELMSPLGTSELLRSNAQIRFYSLASARNPENTGSLNGTFSLVAPNVGTQRFWAVMCMLYNSTSGIFTYRDLRNGTFSVLLTSAPVAQNYCA